MTRTLKMLAPYLAVLLFWCVFKSAWGTIIAYHVQILLWSRDRLPNLLKGWDKSLFLCTALPCALAGPIAYVLLPFMTGQTQLAEWLAGYGLSGMSLMLMIPYFGLVHPLLEQAHWSGCHSGGWLSHLAFAGYHSLVLYSLLTPPWLALCLVVLFSASALWAFVQTRTRPGLLVTSCGHVLADLGIVLAAWLKTM